MIAHEPIRGTYAYLLHPWLLSLSGLDQFEPFMKGELPLAPLFHLTGLVVADVAPGAATFEMPASPCWQSAAGVFTAGAYAFVADGALGSAIYTDLPPGTALATSELSMHFLRPAGVSSGKLVARGRVIQEGRSQGLSEAVVEDARGVALAHSTSRCILTSLPFDPMPVPEVLELPPLDPPQTDPPDPYLRPPDGQLTPDHAWDSMSGMELMTAWTEREIPLAPVAHLLGWRPVEFEEGRAVSAFPATEWFCTAYRGFYGGAIALFADFAMNTALTTTLPPRTCYATLDLKVNFLRPLQPDGREVVADARVAHRGKTVAVTTVELSDADGKRVALASASSMLLPGRPWRSFAETAPMDEPPLTAEET